MKISRVGVDLAKSVFQLHGADAHGKAVWKRKLSRQLTLHQDRGSPVIVHGYLDLMRELDVTCSHSHPRVSNDNPFSESQFQTQKYQPDYPGRFSDASHALRCCEAYFDWYNFEHHHSGLAATVDKYLLIQEYEELWLARLYLAHGHRGTH